MKKFLAFLILAAPLIAQVSPPTGTSRTAGRFVAYNYGQWNLAIYSFPNGTGSKTFTLSNATVQLGDGRSIMPFNTNAQVVVGTETVTLTSIGSGCRQGTIPAGSCSLTATFSNPHTNADRVSSATFGLQEALNDAGASGGGAVTVDTAWTGLGGTAGIVNAATLPSNTKVEDMRTGGGSGSGTVIDGAGTTTPGLDAISTAVAHTQTYAQRACPFVTDAPYNAACDGHTDDSAAIQAAMDANACIQFPISTALNLQECNVATGLVQNNLSLTMELNFSNLSYSGTGALLSGNSLVAFTTTVRDGALDLTSTTGTPAEIDGTKMAFLTLENIQDPGSGPTGYYSVLNSPTSTIMNGATLDGVFVVSPNSVLAATNSSFLNDLTLSSGAFLTMAGNNIGGNLIATGSRSVNGNANLGGSIIGSPQSGVFSYLDLGVSPKPHTVIWGPVVPGIIYSAAGAALPTCDATNNVGANATVSDATYLTGAYVSGGTYTAPVYCQKNGSSYTWSMTAPAGGGSGTVSGQANNVIPLASAATALTKQSALSDNGATVTSTEPIAAPSFTASGAASGYNTLSGSVSGAASLSVAAAAGTPSTVLLPTADPTVNQVLQAASPASCTGYPTANCVQTSWGLGGGGLVAASTPAFSPVAGTYSATQSVTASCTYGTVECNITGSAPVISCSGISVASSETINAGCFGLGYSPTLASAAYVINIGANDNFPGSSLSANWTFIVGSSGDYTVSGGYIYPHAAGSEQFYCNATSFPRAQCSSVTIGTPSTHGAGAAVLVTASGGYIAGAGMGGAKGITKYTASGDAYASLSTGSQAWTAGDVLKLCSDNAGNLTEYRNGVSISTASDTTWTTGEPGVFGYGQPTTSVGVWVGSTN